MIEDPELNAAFYELVGLCREQGKLVEAEKRYRRAVDRFGKALEPEYK